MAGDTDIYVRSLDDDNFSTSTAAARWLTTSATTTWTLRQDKSEMADININILASSSMKLIVLRQFSNNGVDFYSEMCSTLASNILETYGAGPCIKQIAVTGTATSSVNLGLTPISSRYIRFQFGASEANAGIWVNAGLKRYNN